MRKAKSEGLLPFLMFQKYSNVFGAKRHEPSCWEAAPEMLKDLRRRSGLTTSQAAKLCLSTLKEWRGWESGRERMHPAIFKTFLGNLSEAMGWPAWPRSSKPVSQKRRASQSGTLR